MREECTPPLDALESFAEALEEFAATLSARDRVALNIVLLTGMDPIERARLLAPPGALGAYEQAVLEELSRAE